MQRRRAVFHGDTDFYGQGMMYFRLHRSFSNTHFSRERGGVVVPEISRFFGIVIRMFFDEHNPPHFHAEYSGSKALFDFQGNILRGSLGSKTATKLVRDWIDLRTGELAEDWELAQRHQPLREIPPLD